MRKSKYIEIQEVGMLEFSKSKIGTVAKFLLSPNDQKNACQEVSSSLKAACVRSKSKCAIKTNKVLIDQGGGLWQESWILEAVITKEAVVND